MRRSIGSTIVKKAIIWAMAFMMAFTPVAGSVGAMTVHAEETTEVVAPVIETTQSENIGDAQDALDTAIDAEAKAGVEAVATIGQGIISQEVVAIINEAEAKKDLSAADQAIKDGEAAVDPSLDKVEQEILNSGDAVSEANKAADAAAKEAQVAQAAELNTQGAATSEDAKKVAERAEIAAKESEAAAVVSQEQVDAAKASYEAAKSAYEQALLDAKAANEAAELAIADASIDAKEAVEAATLASQRADSFKIAMDDAATKAAQLVEAKKVALDNAQDELDKAKDNLEKASKDTVAAGKEMTSSYVLLQGSKELLAAAKAVEASADQNLEQKKDAIDALKEQKKLAEEAVKAAKAALDANPNPTKAEIDAVAAAQGALDTASITLSDAQTKLTAAEQLENDAKAEAATDYGKAITALEASIKQATSVDEVNKLTQDLIKTVIAFECSNDTKKISSVEVEVAADGTTYFKATDINGVVSFYGKSSNPDGSISIYEYTKKDDTTFVLDHSVTGITNISGLTGVNGTDYTLTVTKAEVPATEALYSVTTKTTEEIYSGDNQRDAKKIQKKNPGSEIITHDVYWGWIYLYTEYTVIKTTSTTVNNVKESDFTKYPVSATKTVTTPAQPAQPAVYTVDYLKPVTTTTYALADNTADGAYSNLTEKVTAAQTAANTARTAEENAKKAREDANNKLLSAQNVVDVKKKAHEEAQQEYTDLKNQYDSYYTRGFITQYQKDLFKASVAAEKAEGELRVAQGILTVAQKNYDARLADYNRASKKFETASYKLIEAGITAGNAFYKVNSAKIDLSAARAAKLLLDTGAAYADKLAEDANTARIKAEEAAAKVEALKGKTNVRAEELAAANKSLKEAEAAYLAAQDAADQAAKAAKDARTSYETAMAKVAELIAIESQQTSGGEAGTTDTEPTVVALRRATASTVQIPVAPVAAAATPISNNRRAGTTATVNNTVEDNAVTTINDGDTALADNAGEASTKTETEEAKTIEDNKTPLEATVKNKEFAWWWILILVVVSGGSFAGLHHYRKAKIQKEETKSN